MFCNPIDFATDQYIHYPINRIGLNSPFFYGFSSFWSLLFGEGRFATVSIIGFSSALISVFLYLLAVKFASKLESALVAVISILLPFSLNSSLVFMLDIPVSLFSIWALYYWVKYLETPSILCSIFFGVFAGMAIFIKPNAIFLSLLVPLSLLFMRKLHYFKRRDLWASVLVVILISGPWIAISLSNTTDGLREYVNPANRFIDYIQTSYTHLGFILTILLLLGITERITALSQQKIPEKQKALWSSLLAFVIATFVFQAFMPVTVMLRYLIPAFSLAPLFLLVIFQKAFTEVFTDKRSMRMKTPTLILVMALCVLQGEYTLSNNSSSLRQAALALNIPKDKPNIILISSTSLGETAFTASYAEKDPTRRSSYIVRGTRFFDGGSGFLTSEFNNRLETPEQALQDIKALGTTHIIVDYSDEASALGHNKILQVLIQKNKEAFHKVWESSMSRTFDTPIIVYKIMGIDVSPTLDFLRQTQKPKKAILSSPKPTTMDNTHP